MMKQDLSRVQTAWVLTVQRASLAVCQLTSLHQLACQEECGGAGGAVVVDVDDGNSCQPQAVIDCPLSTGRVPCSQIEEHTSLTLIHCLLHNLIWITRNHRQALQPAHLTNRLLPLTIDMLCSQSQWQATPHLSAFPFPSRIFMQTWHRWVRGD